MPFQLFGLSPEATMTLLFGASGAVFAAGLIAAIIALCCCCREAPADGLDTAILQTVPSSPTVDDLIPPIYYTAELKDPLFQADLRDPSVSAPLS
jgi:hypothetical protein